MEQQLQGHPSDLTFDFEKVQKKTGGERKAEQTGGVIDEAVSEITCWNICGRVLISGTVQESMVGILFSDYAGERTVGETEMTVMEGDELYAAI